MNNVRAAFEWCFGAEGNATIGIRLAAAAVEIFLAMSLLPECHRWTHRARRKDRGKFGRNAPTGGLGSLVSSSQMYGESDAVNDALNRSLSIAEARSDTVYEAGLPNMQ